MHIPVLQKEVLKYLDPKSNENFIDCTIGEGGHTLSILEKNKPNGKVLGIDQDPEILKRLSFHVKHLGNRLVLVCDNFVNLKQIAAREKFHSVSGILFDLGMSSWHLEESKRGFSFLRNEPLDMRYNPENPLTPLEVNGARQKHKKNKPLTGLTASKIVNYWSQLEIVRILKEYGEERYAEDIAREIINARKLKPIKTTFQLAGLIKKVVPKRYALQRLHPATRTFLALRIAVNEEIENLKKVLPQAIELLRPGGKLAVISFHSLEDRVVKNFYKSHPEKIKILTKKPIRPTKEEIRINPRSRSAKLRACQKF